MRSGRTTPTRSELGGVKLRIAIGVLALVLVAGVSFLVATRHTADSDDEAAGRGSGASGSAPTILLDEPTAPEAVLESAAGPVPSSADVRDAIGGLTRSRDFGSHLGIEVAPLSGGRPLFSSAEPVVTPASTMKLLTTLTVLDTVGPQQRFETAVIANRTRNRIVLVGGGDPLLTDLPPTPDESSQYPARATLKDLATQTARSLRSDGTRVVTLDYDDSLFAGPAVNPTWEPSYIPESIVSPITALWINEGRAVDGLAQRAADPSRAAAERFSDLLKQKGIRVRGELRSVVASSNSAEIASVASAPLAEIVQHVLEVSDNEGAEILLRQAAIGAGRSGSFTGGVDTIRDTFGELGIGLPGARLHDGSGLSRADRVSVSTLVDVLATAASADHPELRAVVSTIPVAGFSGSLDYRLVGAGDAGLGVVRAKTGTLTGVHGLAGIVVTRAGSPLLFAEVADRVPVRKTLDARAQLDRIAGALATLR